MVINKQIDLEKLDKEPNTLFVKEELLQLSGVGPKVADCILLFSDLKRFDVFPIDVWVRRVMNELYLHQEDEEKISKKEIEKIAIEKFADMRGLAQQYLFYHRRSS
jgi:N-glycosylase/DNA lyase